ncbi:MAG: hypothetical protein Q4B60_07020 [Erysipelotrichaceae bacterium]|nr:hypothetical protein [Erysipelotrichaceae bacterium]
MKNYKLLTGITFVLAIAGLILVFMSIWGIVKFSIWGIERPVWTLPAGLFCAVLSNVLNLLRLKLKKGNK